MKSTLGSAMGWICYAGLESRGVDGERVGTGT
jgi:hypothetical protein